VLEQQERDRFRQLCRASDERALTPGEQAELAELVLEAEGARVRRATERLRAHIKAIEAENGVFRTVLEQGARATFAARVEAFLADREAERRSAAPED
jgi:hypothetical protein